MVENKMSARDCTIWKGERWNAFEMHIRDMLNLGKRYRVISLRFQTLWGQGYTDRLYSYNYIRNPSQDISTFMVRGWNWESEYLRGLGLDLQCKSRPYVYVGTDIYSYALRCRTPKASWASRFILQRRPARRSNSSYACLRLWLAEQWEPTTRTMRKTPPCRGPLQMQKLRYLPRDQCARSSFPSPASLCFYSQVSLIHTCLYVGL